MKDKRTISRVLRYIKRYWVLIVCSIFFAAGTVALTLYVPVVTGDAVDLIVGKGNVDFTHLIKLLIRLVIVILVTSLMQWIMNSCNNRIVYNVVKDIRVDAFHKLGKLPFRYMDSRPHGEVVSRIIADVDQFSDGLIMGFTQFFTGAITILGTLAFMFSINFWIALVVVILTPLSLFIANFIAKRTYDLFREQSETRAEQTSLIDEMIGNQRVVKAYGREQDNVDRFNEINGRLEKTSLKATFFSSLVNPATRFVNSTIYAVVGIVGALTAITGGMSVGQLSSFLSYSSQYTKPFNEISGVITELQNALACAGRVFELIDEQEEVSDEDAPEVIEEFDGKVELNDVYFSYSEYKPLITGFDLKVEPGQRVAIVGPTGCGKTTLINLLMRFYDVNKGSISVSGKDIRDLKRKNLRSGYGMVLQDTWLQSGTVRENIRMGKPDATDEEIIEAAKAAHSHSFIMRLKDGYDTLIGEDGGNLSQGQKQLLCITRVMLCLPPMLILDEATSSIDTRTEIRIQKAFALMMKGRTSFIVAHRLSTIRSADVILVMKDGNIIEKGNHASLMAQGGFYSELYNSQFKQ
ncbi:MAG: ABC transporter ATP-binding protein [Clostridia bacterium]|nr:ABC transporter ATP-binding protein [Clostridia bacterium]MBQ5956214.1 ABC transporter ATP-binding protein [Clostridia bacterium]